MVKRENSINRVENSLEIEEFHSKYCFTFTFKYMRKITLGSWSIFKATKNNTEDFPLFLLILFIYIIFELKNKTYNETRIASFISIYLT